MSHLIFFIIRLDHALAFLGTAVGLMMKPVAVAADAAAAAASAAADSRGVQSLCGASALVNEKARAYTRGACNISNNRPRLRMSNS
jgi:hypothetical protein